MKTIFFLCFTFTARLLVVDIVVPGQVGNSDNPAPFDYSDFRLQQIYDASASSSLAPIGGGSVTGLWFRTASGGG